MNLLQTAPYVSPNYIFPQIDPEARHLERFPVGSCLSQFNRLPASSDTRLPAARAPSSGKRNFRGPARWFRGSCVVTFPVGDAGDASWPPRGVCQRPKETVHRFDMDFRLYLEPTRATAWPTSARGGACATILSSPRSPLFCPSPLYCTLQLCDSSHLSLLRVTCVFCLRLLRRLSYPSSSIYERI